MSEPFLGTSTNLGTSPTTEGSHSLGSSSSGFLSSGEGSSVGSQQHPGSSSISSSGGSSSSAPAPTDSSASSIISDASLDTTSDPTQQQQVLHFSFPSNTTLGHKLAASSTSASSSSPSTPPNKTSNINLFGSEIDNSGISGTHSRSNSFESDITATLSNLSLRGAPLTPQMSGDSGIFAWNGETSPTYHYESQQAPGRHYQDDFPNFSSQQQRLASRAITGGGGSYRPSPSNSSYSSSRTLCGSVGSPWGQMSPNSSIGRQDWSSPRCGPGGYPGHGFMGGVGRPPHHSTPNGMGCRPPRSNMTLPNARVLSPKSSRSMYDHLGDPPFSAPPETGMDHPGHRGRPPFSRPPKQGRTPFFPGNDFGNVDGTSGT